jgi:hypothetical protein
MSGTVPLPAPIGPSAAVTLVNSGNVVMRRMLIALAFGGVGLAIGASIARAFPPALPPPR